MDFIYDESGKPFALKYTNGTATPEVYYYVLNLQGDVVGLVNSSGGWVAQYTYNAWGEIITSSGTMASINPLRYRGYYYDTETGFYYLQSRYYDPVTHRFINADGYASTDSTDVISCNMFAYCGNNPIMYVDVAGYSYAVVIDEQNYPPFIFPGIKVTIKERVLLVRYDKFENIMFVYEATGGSVTLGNDVSATMSGDFFTGDAEVTVGIGDNVSFEIGIGTEGFIGTFSYESGNLIYEYTMTVAPTTTTTITPRFTPNPHMEINANDTEGIWILGLLACGGGRAPAFVASGGGAPSSGTVDKRLIDYELMLK